MSLPSDGRNGTRSSSELPIILCLHGGGTNAMIFNIQTMRIQRALASHFEFVFLDGPFVAPPGPGVLPFFTGCEPFFHWSKILGVLPPETKELIQTNMKGKEERFVGVLGFSEGAKVGAGLLLEQQLREKVERVGQGQQFKFGVFLNGPKPIIVSESLTDEERSTLITTPSLVAVGVDDEWKVLIKKLFDDHFDPTTAHLLEFNIGHRLPVKDTDTEQITQWILKVYQDSLDDMSCA